MRTLLHLNVIYPTANNKRAMAQFAQARDDEPSLHLGDVCETWLPGEDAKRVVIAVWSRSHDEQDVHLAPIAVQMPTISDDYFAALQRGGWWEMRRVPIRD
jgi:hypothetical protein